MIISIVTFDRDFSRGEQLCLVAKCILRYESIVSRSQFLIIRILTGEVHI